MNFKDLINTGAFGNGSPLTNDSKGSQLPIFSNGPVDVRKKNGELVRGFNVETGNAFLYNDRLTDEEKAEVAFRQALNANIEKLRNSRIAQTLEQKRQELREIQAMEQQKRDLEVLAKMEEDRLAQQQASLAKLEQEKDPENFDYKYSMTRPINKGIEELQGKATEDELSNIFTGEEIVQPDNIDEDYFSPEETNSGEVEEKPIGKYGNVPDWFNEGETLELDDLRKDEVKEQIEASQNKIEQPKDYDPGKYVLHPNIKSLDDVFKYAEEHPSNEMNTEYIIYSDKPIARILSGAEVEAKEKEELERGNIEYVDTTLDANDPNVIIPEIRYKDVDYEYKDLDIGETGNYAMILGYYDDREIDGYMHSTNTTTYGAANSIDNIYNREGSVNPCDANGIPLCSIIDVNYIETKDGRRMRFNAGLNLASPTVQAMITSRGADMNMAKHRWAATLPYYLKTRCSIAQGYSREVLDTSAYADIDMKYILPDVEINDSYNIELYTLGFDGIPIYHGNPENAIRYYRTIPDHLAGKAVNAQMVQSLLNQTPGGKYYATDINGNVDRCITSSTGMVSPPVQYADQDANTLNVNRVYGQMPFNAIRYNNYNYGGYGTGYNGYSYGTRYSQYGNSNYGFTRVINDRLNRPDNLFTGATGYSYYVNNSFVDAQKEAMQKMCIRLKMVAAWEGKPITDQEAAQRVNEYLNPKLPEQTKEDSRYQRILKHIAHMRRISTEHIHPITREVYQARLVLAETEANKKKFAGHNAATFLNEDIGVLLRDAHYKSLMVDPTNRSLAHTYDKRYYHTMMARDMMEKDPELCKQDPYAMALLSDSKYNAGFDLSKYVRPGEQYPVAPIGPNGMPIGDFTAHPIWSKEEVERRRVEFIDHVKKRVYEMEVKKAQNRAKKKGAKS